MSYEPSCACRLAGGTASASHFRALSPAALSRSARRTACASAGCGARVDCHRAHCARRRRALCGLRCRTPSATPTVHGPPRGRTARRCLPCSRARVGCPPAHPASPPPVVCRPAGRCAPHPSHYPTARRTPCRCARFTPLHGHARIGREATGRRTTAPKPSICACCRTASTCRAAARAPTTPSHRRTLLAAPPRTGYRRHRVHAPRQTAREPAAVASTDAHRRVTGCCAPHRPIRGVASLYVLRHHARAHCAPVPEPQQLGPPSPMPLVSPRVHVPSPSPAVPLHRPLPCCRALAVSLCAKPPMSPSVSLALPCRGPCPPPHRASIRLASHPPSTRRAMDARTGFLGWTANHLSALRFP